MATPIRIKRSSVPGKKPTTEQLQLGELAVNFYDGKLFFKQDTQGVGIGTRIVEVGAGQSTGKTIYVTSNGNDNNTGVNDLDAKATIAAAIGLCVSGDTVKVLPGTYVENNPIDIPDNVSIEGTELRRCLVQPQDAGKDLFYVGNGAHVTDLSFIGNPSTNGAAVIAFRPLAGVSSDRFFDAARLIRQNVDFIAEETAGYIGSSDYTSDPPLGTPPSSAYLNSLKDRVKSTYLAISHDITRGGNSKCVGIGTLFTSASGVDKNTLTALYYSAGIARAVVTNSIWSDKPEGSQIGVSTADYDGSVGILTITTSSSHGLETDDVAEVKNITFQCDSGQTVYPKGSIGYNFPVYKKVSNDKFEIVVGLNTRTHTYVSGGTIQKQVNYQSTETQLRDLSIQGEPSGGGFNNALASCSNVVSAIYTCVGIVTAISGNDVISGNPTTDYPITINYPGNDGAISSGILTASYSPSQGVGIITKGPYIRNCTNFIPNSIGARVDGFNSDEGDVLNNIGVQGSFNVDSYTQYNQGGIGVSVTNGAYCQLVSIFTICDEIGIYAGKGGQCDLTNSNSSFGMKGLVAEGGGDENSKCLDRYTGKTTATATISQPVVSISGVGNNRPYNGQNVYFDKKYSVVSDILVTNGGSGYTSPPVVTVDAPTGPGIAIPAQATAEIANGAVTRVLLRGGGSQYEENPTVTFSGGGGVGAAATCVLDAIYYTVNEATVPSSGVSTVTLVQNLNNEVSIGTTAYFSRQSLQIVSSHSFQYIGAGNTIETAYPSKGAVSIPENEVITLDGGQINYTSTDERGNFRIGDGVVIDQATGTVSGNIYIKSLFTQVTPFILALGGD